MNDRATPYYIVQFIFFIGSLAAFLAGVSTLWSMVGMVVSVTIGLLYHIRLSNEIKSVARQFNITTQSASEALQNLQQQLNLFRGESQNVSKAIENLQHGKEQLELTGQSGDAIRKLQSTMFQMKQDEQRRVWAVQGLAGLAEIRNQEGDLTTYSFHVVSNLVKYVNGNQGALYILNEENGEQELKLLSAYAYGKRKFSDNEIKVKPGEGLLGQCVLEKDMIYMTAVPKNYVKITSGLGEATPTCIVILPLMFRDNVHGVIEMAAFKPMEKFEIEFLRKAAENIGAELYSIQNHEHTRKLLEQSQLLSTELRSQEEEMRQNIEEMQATQEEMGRKQAELTSVFDSINRAMGAAEFSISGIMLSCNSTLQNYFEWDESQLKKQNLIWLCAGPIRAEKVRQELSLGKSYTEEYALMIGSKIVWLNATFNPVQDSKGQLHKILMLAQNVTHRKSKEQEFETLSLVADNTDNSVVITDADGRIIYVNNGFTRLTEYSLEECIGKKPGDFLQGAETDVETVKRISARLKSSEPIYEEMLNYSKTGRSYWISMAINPVKNKEGKVEKYISIQADITETKRRALDFHYKLDSISRTNAMIEFDAHGKIMDINDFFLRVTEFEKEDLIGKSYEVLIPELERNKPQILVMWKNLLVGQAFTGEFTCVDANGKEQWVSGTYNPIFDLQGKLSKIMMLGQFVTDDREKQQELKQYVNVLKQSFPLLEVNSQLQLKSCNEKFLTLTKLKRMEFSKKKIDEVLTDDSVIDLDNIFKLGQDQPFHTMNLAVRNGKDPHIYSSSISLIKNQSNQLLRAIIVLKKEEFIHA